MPGRARRNGGLTAGAPAVFDRKPYTIPYKKFVLANGLTLIVHEDHSTSVVGVNVWYHVGSRNEARGKTGFAHLFEHFFNGSQNYPHGFREAMDDLGSNNRNGTTNTDRTNFFEDVPVSALERTLFLESDRMGFLGNYRQALELWHLWPVDVPARPARVHGVAPVQTDKTKESMLEVAKEIKGVAGERPLAGEEYASIMRNMTSRLAGRFATLSALECAAITSLNLGLPDSYWSAYAGNIRSLTEAQLAAASGKFVRADELVWLVIGDLRRIEAGVASSAGVRLPS